MALKRDTGQIAWRREIERPRQEKLHNLNHPTAPSPASDGRNVFVFFGDFGLISYTPDGAERWRMT